MPTELSVLAVTLDSPCRAVTSFITTVESVDQAHLSRVLAVAEHVFRNLTGYSRESLAVALLSVSAEDQAGYPQRPEAFAEQNRDRLTELYRTYRPEGVRRSVCQSSNRAFYALRAGAGRKSFPFFMACGLRR
ncbi:hypothetical protein AB0D14_43780 [Streptomyces sp. NPDC048484]|uniref:hypothetical protein n=1 Tax=Streptomyces sp. NPDC048484 TaxID=3155146 RepID=UPI0034132C0C